MSGPGSEDICPAGDHLQTRPGGGRDPGSVLQEGAGAGPGSDLSSREEERRGDEASNEAHPEARRGRLPFQSELP